MRGNRQIKQNSIIDEDEKLLSQKNKLKEKYESKNNNRISIFKEQLIIQQKGFFCIYFKLTTGMCQRELPTNYIIIK